MRSELCLTNDQRLAVEAFRQSHRTALLTLLFTDIEGSTALRNQIGEMPAVDLDHRLDERLANLPHARLNSLHLPRPLATGEH